jgi:hypothetical protein
VYLSTREEYSSYVLAWYVHGAKESCLENDLYGELMNLYQVTIGILIRVFVYKGGIFHFVAHSCLLTYHSSSSLFFFFFFFFYFCLFFLLFTEPSSIRKRN